MRSFETTSGIVRIVLRIDGEGNYEEYNTESFCTCFNYGRGYGKDTLGYQDWFQDSLSNISGKICEQVMEEGKESGVYEVICELEILPVYDSYTGEYDEDYEIKSFKLQKLDDFVGKVVEEEFCGPEIVNAYYDLNNNHPIESSYEELIKTIRFWARCVNSRGEGSADANKLLVDALAVWEEAQKEKP